MNWMDETATLEKLTALEAEQELIGKLMMSPASLSLCSGTLAPDDFTEAVHAQLYTAMLAKHADGQTISPLTLRECVAGSFETPEAASKYLVTLSGMAINISDPRTVAEYLADLSAKRQLYISCQRAITELTTDRTAYDIASDITLLAQDAAESSQRQFITESEVCHQILNNLNLEGIDPQSTGLPRLDGIMGGGLYPGYTYGIGGRKKMGKTTLAGTISDNLKNAGVKHLFVALEMHNTEIVQRKMARSLNVYTSAFRSTAMRSDFEFHKRVAAQAANSNDVVIYRRSAGGITLPQLQKLLMAAVYQHRIKGFILDYWQLVQGTGNNRVEHLDNVAQWLANFARKNGIWCIVTAQMNQDGNTRGSEGLRNACDMMLEYCKADPTQSEGWIEMKETRYTEWADVGNEHNPAYELNERGVWLKELPFTATHEHYSMQEG